MDLVDNELSEPYSIFTYRHAPKACNTPRYAHACHNLHAWAKGARRRHAGTSCTAGPSCAGWPSMGRTASAWWSVRRTTTMAPCAATLPCWWSGTPTAASAWVRWSLLACVCKFPMSFARHSRRCVPRLGSIQGKDSSYVVGGAARHAQCVGSLAMWSCIPDA